MTLNPEVTLGNILSIVTMIGGLIAMWSRLRASVESLAEKQKEQGEILKSILDDRSTMQILANNLVHAGERITALGARVDAYHERLHKTEDSVHILTTSQEVMAERMKRNKEPKHE